jgi:hypothetical protein
MKNAHESVRDQAIGAIVQQINSTREEDLRRVLSAIQENTVNALNLQDQRLASALLHVDKITSFLEDKNHILGSNLTKHGEIAEHIEVGIRNARDVLRSLNASATFEGVGRTAPTDYMINGQEVQSKFINGVNKTLDHVIDHMGKYKDFGRNGDSYYHIPKDYHQIIEQIKDGKHIEGLSSKTINKIQQKINEIESLSGHSFDDVVQPSLSKYSEVQMGVADQTIQNHRIELTDHNEQIKEKIRDDGQRNQQQAMHDHAPSLQEGLKAGAIGAAVGGGLNLAVSIYKKSKDGRHIFDYDANDWKDVGLDFGKGALKGGITGTVVYGFTNYMNTPAPLASAFVSATFGVTSLYKDYVNGDITFSEFVENSEVLCLETGFVALGSVIGQALIPIPVVGAVVGSLVSNVILGICRDQFTAKENELRQYFDEKYHQALLKINHEYQKIINNILDTYKSLGGISQMAFNFDSNVLLRFESSQKLAMQVGVERKQVLSSLNDIDNFFLN